MHHQYDVVIVGGGHAALRVAEGCRSAAPDLSIAIVGEEIHLPHERPPLSKEALLTGDISRCFPRQEAWFAEQRIALHRSQRINSIDRRSRSVLSDSGDQYGYSRLVLATGSRARAIGHAGSENLLRLRTIDDAMRIRDQLRLGRRLAIVGGGFIGLEVAAAARQAGCQVTVLESAPRLLSRGMLPAAGSAIERLHRMNGVELRLGCRVTSIEWNKGAAATIDIAGERISADAVLSAIGIVPNVELAEEAGLEVDNGIVVNSSGVTSDPLIYAAGEVVSHPIADRASPVRLESWSVAQNQAAMVGLAVAGEAVDHRDVPWFWSDQYDTNIQVLGYPDDGGDVICRQYDDKSAAFVVIDKDRRLKSITTINAGRDIAVGRRILQARRSVDPGRLADPSCPLKTLLA